VKPKRPTETDLLALVQNGFNTQLPKDRAAQASAPGPAPMPKADDTAKAGPSPLAPMVRITLTIPEELRYRLKMTLMSQRRTTRNKMTQDEYCATAIADLLDLEEDKANPWSRAALLTTFIQNCLEEGGLTKEWVPRAKTLLKEISDFPCTRHQPPFPDRGAAYPAPMAGSRGASEP
jgi:hypothetical protein